MSRKRDNRGRILVVEDDPDGLHFFRTSLRTAGFEILSAASAAEAEESCAREGFAQIDAVLTDMRMPQKTGLELLQWLRRQDPSLSTVIITAQGEKELVKRTLESGGAGFLEKPIKHQALVEAMDRAVERTRSQRRVDDSQKGLKEASAVDQILNRQVPDALRDRLQVRYFPLHEMGGDFINTSADDDSGQVLLLVGDVSGHDLRSGFISAYFQGIFRGHIDAGSNLGASLKSFNNMLMHDADVVPSTLAMAWLRIDVASKCMTVFNCGFPPFHLTDRDGFLHRGELGTHPLGWFEDLELIPQQVALENIESLHIFTDGVVDYADQLGIDPLSLVYRLFHTDPDNRFREEEEAPPDDILCVTYQFNPNLSVKNVFEPLIDEQYSGAEYVHIDNLQSVWRRSLQYALESEDVGDRLYDLLICIREGMLNALIHGCAGSSEKFCHLMISYNRDDKCVRVRIDDPGKGHDFVIEERLRDLDNLPEGRQLGLGIVQHLSDDFNVANKGTSLIFDFYLVPEKAVS